PIERRKATRHLFGQLGSRPQPGPAHAERDRAERYRLALLSRRNLADLESIELARVVTLASLPVQTFAAAMTLGQTGPTGRIGTSFKNRLRQAFVSELVRLEATHVQRASRGGPVLDWDHANRIAEAVREHNNRTFGPYSNRTLATLGGPGTFDVM